MNGPVFLCNLVVFKEITTYIIIIAFNICFFLVAVIMKSEFD